MKKRNNIIYWVTTGFLAFGMLAQGITQISQSREFVDMMAQLGYPPYLLYIIGAWKILGVVAILIPNFKLVKEWAYAGFFFVMSGAAFSHIANHDPFKEIMPALILLIVIVASWYFRPASRTLAVGNVQPKEQKEATSRYDLA